MIRSWGQSTAVAGTRGRGLAALGALGLTVAALAGCGGSDADAEAGGCDPEDLTWVYTRITDPESPAYPKAVFRLQNGSETQLTDEPDAGAGAVSPDGSQIVFARGSEGDPESAGYSRYRLYVIASDGSDERPLLDPAYEPERDDGAPSWDTNPIWSPDGSHIAFVRNSGFTESGAKPGDVHAVMVVPAAGGEPRPLPGDRSDLWDSAPAWSPDGSRLAWVTEQSSRLHWAAVDGGDSGTIPLPKAFGTPAWAKGGEELIVPYRGEAFDDVAAGLYRVDVATGDYSRQDVDPITDLWALPTGDLAGVEPVGDDASRLVVIAADDLPDRREIATLDGEVTGLATAVPDEPNGWADCV